MFTEIKNISSNELKKQILKKFKRCSPPLIFDRKFTLCSEEDWYEILKNNSVKDIPFYNELFDCNRYSKGLISEISKWQVNIYNSEKKNKYKFPVAIGFCLTDIGNENYHAVCLILTSEFDFLFIEPQTNEIIKISNYDSVIFVDF